MERIRDGDHNTKYFHTTTIIRRRQNRVEALRDRDGTWCTDEKLVQKIVVDHFQQLFTEENDEQCRGFQSVQSYPVLNLEQRKRLADPFTEEEVHQVLKTMNPFKAPGPDGFQAFFFQEC